MRKPRVLTYEKIEKSKRLKSLFVKAFKEELASLGEILNENPTADWILTVFKTKGYWSGVRYNISFDFDLGFESEERRFGA